MAKIAISGNVHASQLQYIDARLTPDNQPHVVVTFIVVGLTGVHKLQDEDSHEKKTLSTTLRARKQHGDV